ncbi:MAG TPA: hypothetical protein VH333_18770 [Pseudonocardiaceae bacterium]|jgi:hypothetical protein|nr:hypothetical protein [Pseudonocardiaceae bacterium]
MERRRLAVVLAGLVLVGGAVTALRLVQGTPDLSAPPPPPPLPTVVKPYSAVGVLVPAPGTQPATPTHLVLAAGPHRLLATWSAVGGATGYEVRWGTGGSLSSSKLVAEPDAELNGLTPAAAIDVQVRAVDSFGQRSAAAGATGRARQDGPAGADNTLVDHFDGAMVPDPKLWRLASPSNCAQAVRGTGENSDRMVLLSECSRTSATLRGRAPFRLDPTAPNGELGRFTIDTDAPGESGELDIDLVPGAVDMIDGSTNDPIGTSPPNTATVDDYLPPGTVRVRIGAEIPPDTPNQPVNVVQVAAGPGTPLVAPVSRTPHALSAPRLGVSVRWDVVLRTDGIEVLRDGVLVAAGNAVPSWRSATALVEFTGSPIGQLQAGVNMIGYGGAPTSAPAVAVGPAPRLDTFVTVTPGSSADATTSTDTGPGSGELRFTVLVTSNTPAAALTVNGVPPKFQVEIGTQVFAAVPAIQDEPLLPNVRYPLVARLPASALHGQNVPIGVSMDVPSTYPGTADVVHIDLEMVPGKNTRPATASDPVSGAPGFAVPPQLASMTEPRILDANGQPVASGQPLPRGRAVLEVRMDALAGQRAATALAGMAGFEVWLDNVELVAVPTAIGGPGIAGTWRVAFDPSHATGGSHVIDVRAFGAQHGTAFVEAFASFTLAS